MARQFFFFFCYVFSPLYIFLVSAVESAAAQDQKNFFYSEMGPFEIWQELTLFIALIYSAVLLVKISKKEGLLLKIWIGLAFSGCLYALGEEISWGQTFFRWQTPEGWAKLNGQQETNLHNTSHLLNQLPRAVLEIGILTGGIVIPLLRRFKPSRLPQVFSPFYPSDWVIPTAVLALTVKTAELTYKIFGFHVYLRKSEVIETLIYNFVLIYLMDIFFRWKQEGRLKS